MSTVIIYFSKFGNTKRIFEEIAEILRSSASVCAIGPRQDVDQRDQRQWLDNCQP